MKKIIAVWVAVVLSFSSYGQLLTEDFTYAAGQLLTANGWSAHSGAGTNALIVTTPGLTYTGHPGSGVGNAVTMTTSGEDANRTFTSTTTGSVYMSFLINVSAAQGGDYFIGLYQTSTIFPIRVYAKSDGTGGFQFGVGKSNSTATYETASRTFGTTYLVVVKYTFNAGTTTDDVVDLWVNPALGGAETTATIPNVTAATITDATSIGAVYLRQGSASSASTQQIDAILAGTTWASVTPGGSAASPALTIGTINSFGSVVTGSSSASQTISLSGANLTGAPGNITITAPNTDFQVSNNNTSWGASTTIAYTSATLAATSFYVRFTPQSNGLKSGNVSLSGGGATGTLAVSGTGTSIDAPVATAASAVGSTGFTANWNAVTGATGYFLDVYTKVPGLVNETLAGWNCATATSASQTADAGNINNLNIQTISLQGSSGTISYQSGPSGANGTPNPYSVSANGWDGGLNTKFWQVEVNTTGATNITVSSLQGSSSTGPKDFKLQYKVGSSGTWADVTGGTVALTIAVVAGNLTTWGALTDVALPAAANNQASVFLRWIMTSNDAINASPVAAGGTSRTSAIYVKGQVNGFVNTYVQQNLNVGNVTSYPVTGLTSSTTYYYVVRATNGVSTSANSNEITAITTAAPSASLSATTLSAFGNVCLNVASTTNSFTITGTNLSTANVTVGPLAGYQFATTAGGTYSTSLNLTQTGGSFSQQVFVQLLPTAVQSYNGNIPVSGGGATAIQVAASGAGVNTLATVAAGSASPVTQTSATVAGSISSNGCSSVTAYGIEYSTTSGFANGSGTAVASTNLSAGSFSSALSGLTQGTTYYYHSFATNGGGTAYSTEGSFTTSSPNPLLTASSLTGFGNVCLNAVGGPNSFTITGTNLTAANIVVGPLTGYTFSITSGGAYTSSLNLTQSGGAYSQQIFVQFTPTTAISYNGNISVSGGGATALNVAVTGAGINTAAAVTTGSASSITASGAVASGSITSIGCSAVSAYGIEYSTTNGFSNGSGTQISSSNLSGGSFTSALTGLTPATTYYYKAFATNGGGTTWGTQQSFTTVSPSMTASTLTGFGNVCINTTTSANSFTLTGSNLSTANVIVGSLAGYAFSTTSTGTFTASLSISQPGGSFTQQVFVQFTPTAVQSYNGTIQVSGGGISSSISVSVTGAGISTPPSVVTGSSSSVTTNTATAGGSISANGCTSVSVYGIEYSTVNGFANGSGTQVVSSNLNAGSFTSALTGLTPGTTYYYKSYATNGGGTAYGAQQSFTTTAPPPPQLTATPLASFGSVCVNALAGPNSFTINGSNLTASLITVGPLAGYSFSQTSGGSYNNTIGIINPGGTQSYTIFVRFNPTAVQSYNGSIPISGGGASSVFVAASGAGVNTPATATTGAASAITTRGATLAGSIAATGCSNVTAYGIEYSSINGFADGSGTKVPSTNLSGGSFQSGVSGLLQGATYYYKAYATSSGGTAYGLQRSFTLSSIGAGFRIFPSPMLPGQSVNLTVSLTGLNPGYHGLQFYDALGRMVHVHHMNVQGNFIDQNFTIPAHLPLGIYEVRLVNFEKELGRQRIILQ